MGTEPWNDDRDAALRAVLVERVETGRALREEGRGGVRSSRPEPRRWQASIVTAVVLVAVVAGSTGAVLLAQQRPATPAGFTAPEPTTSAAAQLDTPASPALSTAPPTAPTADPSSVPETTAPPVAVTTPPATSEPTSLPSSALPSGTPTSGVPLIAPDGWNRITRAELHAFVVGRFSDDPANAAIWEEQAWLDIRCMADQGFLFDPIGEVRTGEQGLTAEERRAYEVAMYGPQTDQPYDWRTAGCHGRSVHLTGQDHAN